MGRRDYILFDLDGTLTNPKEGIIKSIQHALAHFRIQTDDLDSLTPLIGPPLRDSFKKYYGFSDEQAWEGVQAYREYFSVGGQVQNKEYPGIKEVLEALKEAGRVLLVTASGPEKFARKILEHFDMADYFDLIGGADMRETRARKGDVVRYVLGQCGLEPNDETIGRCTMVGDREHGVLGTRECGMEHVDAPYGYGGRQEMDERRPAQTAGAVKELRDLPLPL